MTIVALHTPTTQGRAALHRAASECLLRREDLVVVDGDGHDGRLDLAMVHEDLGPVAQEVEAAGLGIDVGASQIHDPADALLQVAQQVEASMVVVGLRRRSPVGKLILGSIAQRILLDADCPVLAVKASKD